MVFQYKKIVRLHISPLALVLLLFTGKVSAQDAATIQSEQSKLLKAPEALVDLGKDLFGDKLNLYNGGLEFVQTDVNIPGNNTLPVMVGRRFVANSDHLGSGMFAHWELEIPRIQGVFSKRLGWQKLDNLGQASNLRCTNFGAPPDINIPYVTFKGFEYWHGTSLYVPGIGDQEILKRDLSNTNVPTDGRATPLVTKNDWMIQCLPNLASTDSTTTPIDAGEGFLAIAPDGTRYRFDWLVTRKATSLSKVSGAQPSPPDIDDKPDKVTYQSLERIEVIILPTLISDRFGNTVRFTYDRQNKNKLLSIESSDGRKISFTHTNGSHIINTASDGTRTWRYNYDERFGQNSIIRTLTSVVQPDNSSWNFAGLGSTLQSGSLLSMRINYPAPHIDDFEQTCDSEPKGAEDGVATGTMVHPSGAVGIFTMVAHRHGRNGVPRYCLNGGDNLYPLYPAWVDSYSLTKKTITGPGLQDMTWSFNYDSKALTGAWRDWSTDTPNAVIFETNPKGEVTRYTFGATYGVNEGLLLRTDYGWTGSSALRSVSVRRNYSLTQVLGTSDQIRGDNWLSQRRIPEDQRITEQNGTTFIWEVPADSDFDSFGRPQKVRKHSSLGYTRTELIDYSDHLTSWVIGQVRSVKDEGSGKVMVRNDYNPMTAQLEKVSRFDQVRELMSYRADGTLETRKDALLRATTYSDYKRGIPQTIRYPDGTSESVSVNNIGKIEFITDPNGYTTGLVYDVMGRVSIIRPPTANTVAWNSTNISFTQVPYAEYNLSEGHWRQEITTGNAKTIRYFDAFWRPVLVHKYDTADLNFTSVVVQQSYDFENRLTFTSYPQRNYGLAPKGTRTEYDAVGRVHALEIDSELGALTTRYEYLSGFKKNQVDPRGNSTVYTYQAFDEPAEDAITSIRLPEGVSVAIQRNIFGKPTAVTRSGDGKSLTRSYVYDGYQRLCKTIEPETGATIQDYDAVDNVAWSASGLAFYSTSSCDVANVPEGRRTRFAYDARDRLKTTNYGDNSPSIERTYTLDGLLETISSNGTKWTYSYNERRLNWREMLSYGGRNYSTERIYDANGSVLQLKYPIDNLSIYYIPNALGRATQIGGFATGIKYHPNGAVQEFTYGNGIHHALEQNVRGLPARTYDAVSESYVYDPNGNPEQIIDHLQGSVSRTMTYDGLNRLKTVSSPGLWGSATYMYDALDNLISSTISSGPNARTLFHAFNPTTNRLDSVSGGPAGFNFSYLYDLQGNVKQRGSQQYKFDLGNRMSAAVGRETYVYDGHGRRVSTIGTNQNNILQIYTQAGQLIYSGPAAGGGTKYVYLNHHQVAEVK